MATTDLSNVPLGQGWALNLNAMHNGDLPLAERLAAGLSVSVNTENYIAFLARMARIAGMTWDQIAEPLQITRQTAYSRYGQGLPEEDRTIIRMVTGVVHPEGTAVWYGLEDDLPGDRNYAHSRAECATAYRLARARADARAKELGAGVSVDDGGIDRGSGVFWDLYIRS